MADVGINAYPRSQFTTDDAELVAVRVLEILVSDPLRSGEPSARAYDEIIIIKLIPEEGE